MECWFNLQILSFLSQFIVKSLQKWGLFYFKPSTTILAYVQESGPLQVSIINLAGRNIRSLYDDVVYEGESWKKIVWNGLDNYQMPVAGGIYFCRITNGKASINHKMILLK